MAGPGGGGGERRRKVPAAHNSKTINDNGIKFAGVVENHQLINLVSFNCHMTSPLRHSDVITVKIWSFFKVLLIKVENFRDVSDLKNR